MFAFHYEYQRIDILLIETVNNYSSIISNIKNSKKIGLSKTYIRYCTKKKKTNFLTSFY